MTRQLLGCGLLCEGVGAVEVWGCGSGQPGTRQSGVAEGCTLGGCGGDSGGDSGGGGGGGGDSVP